MLLRCTTRLRELLGEPVTEDRPTSPEDWYANLLWVQRRRCLLVTHAGTLYSIFAPNVPAADLRTLGAYIVPMIRAHLTDEGFPASAFGTLDPARVMIDKTADRRVLGCMNNVARGCQHAAADAGGLGQLDLSGLHHRLQRNITSAQRLHPACRSNRRPPRSVPSVRPRPAISGVTGGCCGAQPGAWRRPIDAAEAHGR